MDADGVAVVPQPGSELAAFGIMDRPAYGILQGMPK
jgi:hypothetical protein